MSLVENFDPMHVSGERAKAVYDDREVLGAKVRNHFRIESGVQALQAKEDVLV